MCNAVNLRRLQNWKVYFSSACLLIMQMQSDAFVLNLKRGKVNRVGLSCPSLIQRKLATVVDAENSEGKQKSKTQQDFCSFPETLIRSLDLIPLMHALSRHTGTNRGRQALLALVNDDEKKIDYGTFIDSQGNESPSRRKWAMMATTNSQMVPTSPNQRLSTVRSQSGSDKFTVAPIAKNADDARKEYERVEQAMLAMSGSIPNLTFPPFYSDGSSPNDISILVETDDDEWLHLPTEAWTLEHILQAEQVMSTLIEVQKWATLEETRNWAPFLSELGRMIDENARLPPIYNEIANTVEIVRVRSLTDPSGKSTFSFRFKGAKFPILKILQEKEADLLKSRRSGKKFDENLTSIHEELEEVQQQILFGMVDAIRSIADTVDEGLDILARLDILFAKAAFGLRFSGDCPKVESEGKIEVQGFVHPILLTRLESSDITPKHKSAAATASSTNTSSSAVPIDLRLSSENGNQVLIISGPNGGGKTLAMKSFGLSSILCKLAIPISTTVSSPRKSISRPRVDFFDQIIVELGDEQNVLDGVSTLTAKLNCYAAIIERVTDTSSSKKGGGDVHCLVLLDELGSGTDPEAGGAIAQAILEELMTVETCHVVATTHSPRLKALSYESSDFGCASVLLSQHTDRSETANGYSLPTFELEYDVIGDSYALGAASRCQPALPENVISRASELITETSNSGRNDSETIIDGVDGKPTIIRNGSDYTFALLKSMEEQVQRAKNARNEADKASQDSAKCRVAMMSLADAYETKLKMLETRVNNCYHSLKSQENMDELEIVGDTLAEIRVVRKQIRSQKDLLAEQGLRSLPDSYELRPGESVVVIAPGRMNGMTAEVVSTCNDDKTLSATEVRVQVSSSFGTSWGINSDLFPIQKESKETMSSLSLDAFDMAMVEEDPFIVQRYELAIWDYDSVWGDQNAGGGGGGLDMMTTTSSSTSVQDSKNRLNSLLSNMKANSGGKSPRKEKSKTTQKEKVSSESQKPFTSARQRKAAAKQKKEKKKKRRK